MNKKGQAAMEFLMTYGWAILVVLAAIGALAYFGVLSPDKFLADKCVVSGGFSCLQYKVTANTAQIEVQNNLGVDVDLANVTLVGTQGNTCTNTTNLTNVANGEKSGLLTLGCAVSGSKYRGDISIIYVKAGESLTHTATGSLTSKVET
jgi:uncharacterized protein (UPF0333 family)